MVLPMKNAELFFMPIFLHLISLFAPIFCHPWNFLGCTYACLLNYIFSVNMESLVAKREIPKITQAYVIFIYWHVSFPPPSKSSRESL